MGCIVANGKDGPEGRGGGVGLGVGWGRVGDGGGKERQRTVVKVQSTRGERREAL